MWTFPGVEESQRVRGGSPLVFDKFRLKQWMMTLELSKKLRLISWVDCWTKAAQCVNADDLGSTL